MIDSLVFIGKFNDSFCLLEEKIINIGCDKNVYQKIDPNIKSNPDVKKIKIQGYDCFAYIILGDVMPNSSLKILISKKKLILFIFNLTIPETLDFLNFEWGPIIDQTKINDQNIQQRFLIGLQPRSDLDRKELDKKIANTMARFNCVRYFEEGEFMTPLKKLTTGSISIYSNLIQFLQENLKQEMQTNHGNVNEKSIKFDDQDKEKSTDNVIIEEEEEENNDNDNNNFEIAIDDLETEIKSYTNEKPIQFKDGNSISYDLYEKSKKAIITKSPQAKGDVFIPTTVNYKSNEYEIIKIADEGFAGSSIESLSFATDSAILMIGNSAFKNSTLKKLFIPKNLKILDDFWLKGANKLDEFEVDPENHLFSFENGFLIYKNGPYHKILFAPRNIEGEFVIPKEITHIGQYSFYKRNDLLSVKSISSKLIKITDNSFYKCKKLKSIKIEQKAKLILGNSCFSQSQSLESVEITCKELKICDGCFFNCIFLSTFNLTCPGLV